MPSFRSLRVVFAAALILSVVLAACGAAPGSSGAIKVALIAPMTGDVSTFGKSTKEGVDLAVKEWNAKGGVNGQKIEIVAADGRCDPQEARNAANKVITQDKVKFIIGEVCSSASIPVSEVANANKVLQISSTSTNDKYTLDASGAVKPYSFRACYTDSFQGVVMANFAANNLKAKTAAVFLDQGNDYVRGLAEVFRGQFEKNGGKVTVWESYTKDDTDFSAILSKVAAAKPDFLFLPDYYPKVNLIAKQAKEKGITAPMGGGDGWDSSELDVKATDNSYYSNHYDPADKRQIVQDWLKNYGTAYANAVPDALATLGYDAANMLFQSMKNAGSNDVEKVRVAMENLTFEGVSGKITLDKNHNPIKPAVVINVKDSKKTYNATVNP